MVIRVLSLLAFVVVGLAVIGATFVLTRSTSMPNAARVDRVAKAVPSAAPAAAASASNRQTVQPIPTAAPVSGPLAPDFDGGGAWINSEPLRLADLRGKVVLVNFWTYGCYNCQNTLPYERAWWDKFRDQGLVIVGVHSPEFAFEAKLENVESAVKDAEIGWPVVQDNDHTIWNAYGNRYWPRFYLIDREGHIIYDHIGEGAYDETERQIAAALAAP